jgi:hypothetical protein
MHIVDGKNERCFEKIKYFILDCTCLHGLENVILDFVEICPSQCEI